MPQVWPPPCSRSAGRVKDRQKVAVSLIGATNDGHLTWSRGWWLGQPPRRCFGSSLRPLCPARHRRRPLQTSSVNYEGLTKITQSDIESELKEKAIEVRLDSFLDAGQLRRIASVIRELYAEKGYQSAEVKPTVVRGDRRRARPDLSTGVATPRGRRRCRDARGIRQRRRGRGRGARRHPTHGSQRRPLHAALARALRCPGKGRRVSSSGGISSRSFSTDRPNAT